MAKHDRWLQRVLLTGLLCAAAGSTAAPNTAGISLRWQRWNWIISKEPDNGKT